MEARRRWLGDDAGFSLIEVFVALAILGLVVSVSLNAIVGGRGRSAEAAERAALAMTARSILMRVGVDLPLKVGSSGGRLGDGTRWAVTIRDEPMPGDRPMPIFHVAVEVAGGGRTARLATLRFDEGEP